jgi:predicted secreted protein
MSEVLQGLLDNGANTTRDALDKLLKKYVKPAAISVEEAPARAPLSVINNVNMEQDSNISSLYGVEGVANLLVAFSNKKAGHPKGSAKASADKENT